MPGMLQRPQTGRSAALSSRQGRHHRHVSLESQAQDANLKLQLSLSRQLRRSDRDRHACIREAERSERDVLLELARILDSRLTLSIDEWFERRKVIQRSLQSDTPATVTSMLARLARPTESGELETPRKAEAAAAAATSALVSDRQRILEAKRADWFGVTSVPFFLAGQKQRPQTAAGGGGGPENESETEAGPEVLLQGGGGGTSAGRLRGGGRRVKSAVAPRS